MPSISGPSGTNGYEQYYVSMNIPTNETDSTVRPASPIIAGRVGRIAMLSERQISYLRLVQQNYTSKEIAKLVGTSYRAVDKQLHKASITLGTSTRLEAVRLLAEYEKGVDSTYPVLDLPSSTSIFPLPPILPNARASANMLTWKQAAIWTAIISIGTPIALTVAGMAFVTLGLLLGMKTP